MTKNIRKEEAEGGCGVIGIACEEKIAGRHLLPALNQLCNRGNGKGGGIAACGLSSASFGVSQEILENDYLLAIAYLDLTCKKEVEKSYISPLFEIDHQFEMPHLKEYKSLNDLDVLPPDVCVYFVKVKESALKDFQETHHLSLLSKAAIEDEIVYQNSFRINRTFYSSLGEKKAFVLSHGKNLLVLKIVGFGDDVIRYYKLEDFKAHVWIGHHRYPTKGKVWHPGGAHPFIGLNEALVHNGDFANYFSICEYLAQRNIYALFLTDTEVAALLFDLLYRTYQYPLEYVIEAIAPTTERDFTLLPKEKQVIYDLLQKTHMHGSPDGPWFFLIAQSLTNNPKGYRLIGITDTSMLRPQVFALQTGPLSIGFAASEKQAIDAVLKSLSQEDSRFWTTADSYWNARGGSYTDGGAFTFTIFPQKEGKAQLVSSNKFGELIHKKNFNNPYMPKVPPKPENIPDLSSNELFNWVKTQIPLWDYENLRGFLFALTHAEPRETNYKRAINLITQLLDQSYPIGSKRKSSLHSLYNASLVQLFESLEHVITPSYAYLSSSWIKPDPTTENQTVVINAEGFPSEGTESLARAVVQMYERGFKSFIIFNCQGQRFIGNGLGPHVSCEIHVYGSSGDYLASGIDGAIIYVHGWAQDQLAQIMKEGTLVIYGDVGQAFMYGAKGGKAFIKGNTAGRPLINAVGSPRVVINGTVLDYLAESFMAGNPLQGGGFVIVNGIDIDEEGKIIELETPYPGSNLFSLASGGAIYIRDPMKKIGKEQLNGGELTGLSKEDWDTILPYLKENETYFQVSLDRLLQFNGKSLKYQEVYRKIRPAKVRVLTEEEAWVKVHD